MDDVNPDLLERLTQVIFGPRAQFWPRQGVLDRLPRDPEQKVGPVGLTEQIPGGNPETPTPLDAIMGLGMSAGAGANMPLGGTATRAWWDTSPISRMMEKRKGRSVPAQSQSLIPTSKQTEPPPGGDWKNERGTIVEYGHPMDTWIVLGPSERPGWVAIGKLSRGQARNIANIKEADIKLTGVKAKETGPHTWASKEGKAPR